MKKLFFATIALSWLLAKPVDAAIVLNSPTTQWYAVQYLGAGSRTDFVNDEQTGINEADLVGSDVGVTPVQTAFYYTYNATSNQVGFRVRTDGDSNPPGFTGAMWVGFMFDSNDSIDLFAGFIDKGPTKQLGFYNPGTGANTSPSTTTIVSGTPIYSESITTSNFLWTAVTVGGSGNDPVSGGTNDIGADGNIDYFATWVLPFNQLQAAATSRGFTVTSTSLFRFVVGTSEQANSMNQDLNGVNAGTTSSSTFSALGATSPYASPSGGVVPEPATNVLLLSAAAAGVWFATRRRKRRS